MKNAPIIATMHIPRRIGWIPSGKFIPKGGAATQQAKLRKKAQEQKLQALIFSALQPGYTGVVVPVVHDKSKKGARRNTFSLFYWGTVVPSSRGEYCRLLDCAQQQRADAWFSQD
jgi:hypothetical protein